VTPGPKAFELFWTIVASMLGVGLSIIFLCVVLLLIVKGFRLDRKEKRGPSGARLN